MAEDRLITIAIHTFQKATVLKSILENEGIAVALQNVNLVQPVVSSGVRVRIHEADLPKALRIIESGVDLDDTPQHSAPAAAPNAPGKVMVPVDFSPHSDAAVEAAFRYAAATGAEILMMHSFISPTYAAGFPLSDSMDFDLETINDDEARLSVEETARRQLDSYATTVRQRIARGELPAVKFYTELIDDVPEDAINILAKEAKPRLIVMGTRPSDTKERDVMGSVTAEVLDSSRTPVLTVPAGASTATTEPAERHILFYCNYEQSDLLALDMLYSLFPDAAFRVTLLKVPTKKTPIDSREITRGLIDYCNSHLPKYTFEVVDMTTNDLEVEFQAIDQQRHIDMIAVPSRKRNIFSRIFNPGLAHRLLLHSDVPMIVLPV